MLTKADSRVSMSMGAYDALGRPTSKSYGAGTPPVSYSYDSCLGGKGRLCGVTTSGSGNEQTSVEMEYDLMGRLEKRTQNVGGISHIVTQSYLPSGLVREIVYPTSTVSLPRKVIYEYWPNGQMREAWQGTVGTGLRYARFEDYQAGGTAQSVTLGNSVVENSQANERGQLVSRSWTKDAVNFHALSFGYGSQNNGNLRTQGISGLHLGVGFNFQQGFDYDSINRLRIFQDNGMSGCGSVAARQQYVFDRYGNRAVLNGSCGNANGLYTAWVAADSEGEVEAKYPNNRWQVDAADTNGTLRHDTSGNVRSASGNLYEYDAENRLAKATAGGFEYRYLYDGDGRRVAVEKWSGATQDVAYTRRFVYGVDGELLAEIQGAVPAVWATKYLGQDHLGTTRVVMKASGAGEGVVDSRHDYYPFGEELPGRGLNYGDPGLLVKYTGKERDVETGLDYFGARYMSAAQGRFTSPDLPFADQHAEDPQSWNLYGYVRNNPLRYTDPTGRCLYPGGDCLQYIIGGAKAVANVVPDTATLLNRGINMLTGSSIPDAARFEGTNYDQQAGMEAASVVMLVTPLAEAASAKLAGAIGTGARVEAGAAASTGRTLQPGLYAGESIRARGPQPTFTAAERAQVNQIGETTGCHTSGTPNPGTKGGNFVPDHQPPSALNPSGGPQQLYPQCVGCS